NGGKNSLNRLIRCVCGKKIGPDPRNFNQRVSLGRNDLLIRTFPNANQLSIDDQINNACAKALSGDKEPLGDFPPDSYAATVSPKVKDAYNEVLKSRSSIVNDQSLQNATSCANLVRDKLKSKGEYTEEK
ncbi:hypothetical protein, partial [Enterobacter hormaechei]